MPYTRWIYLAGAVSAIMLVIALTIWGPSETDKLRADLEGLPLHTSPCVEVDCLTGFNIAEQQTPFVLLVYWNTGCLETHNLDDYLVMLQERFGGRELRLVGVNELRFEDAAVRSCQLGFPWEQRHQGDPGPWLDSGWGEPALYLFEGGEPFAWWCGEFGTTQRDALMSLLEEVLSSSQ